MQHTLTAAQQEIREAVLKICSRFGDDYWLAKDRDGGFPLDFHRAMADAGWLGIAMPEAYGGSGLGITEAAVMLQAVAESGAAFAGASALHMNIFGLNPVVVFGTEEQKQRFLPPLIKGDEKACFAVTEPDAGLDTTKLKTRAVRDGNRYLVHGQKIWISTAQVAERVLLLARTTPLEQVKKPTQGLSLFYTALDRRHVEVREIDKMGRKAVNSNQLFFDGLPVPVEDRIGEEGRGFEYILHGMNPERILIGAEAIGTRARGPAAGGEVCQGARRLQSSDRPEPGDPASARQVLDGAGGGQPDGDEGGPSLRRRTALRRGGQRHQVSRSGSRLRGVRDGGAGARRHGLRQGVPRRATDAGGHAGAHRAGDARADPVPRRREGARPAEVVLSVGTQLAGVQPWHAKCPGTVDLPPIANQFKLRSGRKRQIQNT